MAIKKKLSGVRRLIYWLHKSSAGSSGVLTSDIPLSMRGSLPKAEKSHLTEYKNGRRKNHEFRY